MWRGAQVNVAPGHSQCGAGPLCPAVARRDTLVCPGDLVSIRPRPGMNSGSDRRMSVETDTPTSPNVARCGSPAVARRDTMVHPTVRFVCATTPAPNQGLTPEASPRLSMVVVAWLRTRLVPHERPPGSNQGLSTLQPFQGFGAISSFRISYEICSPPMVMSGWGTGTSAARIRTRDSLQMGRHQGSDPGRGDAYGEVGNLAGVIREAGLGSPDLSPAVLSTGNHPGTDHALPRSCPPSGGAAW